MKSGFEETKTGFTSVKKISSEKTNYLQFEGMIKGYTRTYPFNQNAILQAQKKKKPLPRSRCKFSSEMIRLFNRPSDFLNGFDVFSTFH